MQDVSESLAGRVGIIHLLGLSSAEIYGYQSESFTTNSSSLMKRIDICKPIGLNQLYDRIFRGSMPALYADETIDWEIYYRSYVDTYLQRDIRDLTQVADEMLFYNFMVVAAAHITKPLVYEELAKETGVSAPTIKKWLSLLMSSHIIALVQPYSNNVLKRVVKMPQMYFFDTGLAAYLLNGEIPKHWKEGQCQVPFLKITCLRRFIKAI